MKCGFCGYDFASEEAGTACGGCPLVKGCHLVRCPRCGYEMPPEAKVITWLRDLIQTKEVIGIRKTLKEKLRR